MLTVYGSSDDLIEFSGVDSAKDLVDAINDPSGRDRAAEYVALADDEDGGGSIASFELSGDTADGRRSCNLIVRYGGWGFWSMEIVAHESKGTYIFNSTSLQFI